MFLPPTGALKTISIKMKLLGLEVICALALILCFASITEAEIIGPPKLPQRPLTPLNEKPAIQASAVTHKTASFVVEIPAITYSDSGREEMQWTPCRGGGNRYIIQLAQMKRPNDEPKWAFYRNFKQTDEGITVGTLKPGMTYLLRAQCEFKYNVKPHRGEWSDPIKFTTLP